MAKTILKVEDFEEVFDSVEELMALSISYDSLALIFKESDFYKGMEQVWKEKTILLKNAQKNKNIVELLSLEANILQDYLQKPATIEMFSSLTQALDQYADAIRALLALQDPEEYKRLNRNFRVNPQIKTIPEDACRKFLSSQTTRILNQLKAPHLSRIEAEFLQIRRENIQLAKSLYKELQKTALEI